MMYIIAVFAILLSQIQGDISPSEDYSSHYCKRSCINTHPMDCVYYFNIEYVRTMEPACKMCMHTTDKCPECIKADGRPRNLIAVNRQMPGPAIHVCYGDTVTVITTNLMYDATTTIHWHGMGMRGTPWMDGVPLVTQCGIHPSTTFTYKFIADEIGTHWYHSHSGSQRGDGLFGALIVHLANDTRFGNYDLPEHVILISDWFMHSALDEFIMDERNRKIKPHMIESILINGIGRTVKHKLVPPSVFRVKQNKKYLFRVVHAGAMSCPMEFNIQGHRMLIVASDGRPLKPFAGMRSVDTIVLTNGERFDFILEANQTVDSYIIRVLGGIHCVFDTSYAVLEYQGSKNKTLKFEQFQPRAGLAVNCVNKFKTTYCIDYEDMESIEPENTALYGTPDYIAYLAVNMSQFARKALTGVGQEGSYAGVINEIAYTLPTAPLLLNPDVDQNFCNFTSMDSRFCHNGHCECVHRIQSPLGKLLELCFIDDGTATDITHPMHLHGYKFIVTGFKKLYTNITRDAVRDMDERGALKRNFRRPIVKDSVSVPDGGYTCIRFIANNPGVWLLHCHVDTHVDMGMQMVLQTGNIPMIPKGFPNCGDYIPIPNTKK